MSRTEVEVLLKMRAEGNKALDLFSGGLGNVAKEGQKAANALDDTEAKTKKVGAGAIAAGAGVALLADRILTGLVGSFKSAITEANKLDAGLIGLSSVAKAFGQDVNKAQMAAQSLASDGLMNVGEAAAGLKNLLAAGFGLDQAVVLMNRFKDSAAFGRQGALDFGQAIIGATEGIKNGNSALVDNAGVTKNLSVILTEAGFSAADLSKAQSDVNVRTAIYNGLLKETNPQLGDTAKLLATSAGAQAQFSNQITIAYQKIGKDLQPAIGATLTVLTPFVKLIGNMAPVLIPAAAALTAIVIPIVALKGAAQLGILPTAEFTKGLIAMAKAAGGLRSFDEARSFVQGLGEGLKITHANLGTFGSAVAVVGTAFVAWQLGRVIAEVFDLDNKIAHLVGTTNFLKLRTQEQGAVQDVVTEAIRRGAAASISYADAQAFIIQTNKANQDVVNRSIAQKRAEVDILERAGKINTDEAIRRRIAIDDEAFLADLTRKDADAHNVLAAAQKKATTELARTGLSMSELIKLYQQYNDLGIELPASLGLSAEALKLLAQKSKDAADATANAEKKSKDHEQQVKKERDALEGLGIVTLPTVVARINELNSYLDRAKVEGADVTEVARALYPEFAKLAEQAKLSGVGIDLTNKALARTADLLPHLQGRTFVGTLAEIPKIEGEISDETRRAADEIRRQNQAQTELEAAYKHFGIETRADLRATAEESIKEFNLIKSSGKATPQEVAAAFKKMQLDVNAANGQIPSFWKTTVVPGITSTLGTLQQAISGSFAQMLLGAKGFGEGFKDIWQSIKSSAIRIFDDIANAFIQGALKRIIGALSGSGGGITAGLGGLLGGGGGGGGGLLGGGLGLASKLPGLLGGGGAAAGQLGLGIAPSVTGLGGGAAAGGGAGGGLGAGFLTNPAFWTNPFTIAGIAGIGLGAAVWKKGLFRGGEESLKVNNPREQYFNDRGNLGGINSTLGQGGVDWAENERLVQNVFHADTVKEFTAATQELDAALAKAKEHIAAAAAAEQDFADKGEKATTTIALANGAAGEAMKPMIQQLIDMGLLIDANGQKITDMGQIAFKQAADSSAESTDAIDQNLDQLRRTLEFLTSGNGSIAGGFDDAFDQAATQAKASLGEIQRLLGNLHAPTIEVRPEYIPPDFGDTSGEPPPDVGGAASGIYAKHPTLAIFGEGGEPEVGGPKSFFKDILAQLDREQGTAQGQGGAGLTVVNNWSIQAIDAADLRTKVETEIMPMLIDTLEANRRQSLTKVKNVLGV